MSKFKNYKEHWLDFFSDSARFKTEIVVNDDTLETIRVSSPNLMNQTTIELIMFIEDGYYTSMFDIRFYHPKHIGFNKFQDLDEYGYEDDKGEFSEENISEMESAIQAYLENGLWEKIYAYNESHFKSEIKLLKDGKFTTITWHDKEHMMSNKAQRFLNKRFIETFTVETGKWV